MSRRSQNLEGGFKGQRNKHAKNLQMKFEPSTNAENFITLFEAPNPTYLGNEVQQFEVDTIHKYNCYRLFCLEAEPSNPGSSYLQLFIYSD